MRQIHSTCVTPATHTGDTDVEVAARIRRNARRGTNAICDRLCNGGQVVRSG